MPHFRLRAAAAGLAVACLLGGSALAQPVMPSAPMPPPPSARDTLARDGSAAEPAKPARKPKRRAATEAAPPPEGQPRRLSAPPAARAATPSYSERIDTRPARGDMQLEDDPRAARPIMQNGRPGVGMRF